jgi:glyoxylase-like metal-dependent hydrolase (beta-lactamase superfamily II)
VAARQLLDTVWLVGGALDDTFTDAHDCHCYLIWDGEDGLLIDAGTGLGVEGWLSNVSEVCDPSRIAGVLVTHYHADHAGGSAAARGAGISVLGHPLTARALATGDEDVTQVARARDVGIYPSGYRLLPASVAPVAPGTEVGRGTARVEVVDAPGHCDGHVVCRYDQGGTAVLFSGDCLFAGGRVSLQAIPDCRLDAYAKTVITLAEHRTDVLLPGHGNWVLEGAHHDLDVAAGAFQRLVPPPNFLTA